MITDDQQRPSDDEPSLAEVERLIAGCCDDCLTDTDVQRLSQALSRSSAARDLYLSYMEAHYHFGRESAVAEAFWVAVAEEGFEADFNAHVVHSPFSVNQRLRKLASKAAGVVITCVAAWALFMTLSRVDVDQHRVAEATARNSADTSRWFVDGRRVSRKTASLNENSELCIVSGTVSVRFESGAVVSVRGPAVMTAISPDHAILARGSARAIVGPAALGFTLETPNAEVVDFGTVFGVGVSDGEVTRVAVFEGEVNVKPTVANRHVPGPAGRLVVTRLRIGEGIELNSRGVMRPLTSVVDGWFPDGSDDGGFSVDEAATIQAVSDNLRTDAGRRGFYEIVPNGMAEDVRAYADRGYHEWNGLTKAGMPEYLIGGDYVRMFNNRKFANDFELYVTLGGPSDLYLLVDDRIPVPGWLTEQFEDTGDDLGMDEGPHVFESGAFYDRSKPGIGPGVSIDVRHSIWRRVVKSPETIVLGGIGHPDDQRRELLMYGIVARERDFSRGM